MASSGNWSVLVHYRSYWREWRPLVTPWADCIKEGVESWKCQKWSFISHVLISVSPFSLLPLLLCSCFGCSYYYYYYCCYYEYVLAKGFCYDSGYGNKPGPKYSNDYGNKPGHLISKTPLLSYALSLSLFLSGSEKLILALVYRPPAQNSNVDNELYEQISDICNHNDAIIFGDFNLRSNSVGWNFKFSFRS